MIINGKRFENLQAFKRRGKKSYTIVEFGHYDWSEELDGPMRREYTYVWVTPFWDRVETKDLEENWSARFFQQIISANSFIGETGDNPWACGQYYNVSWNQIPEIWQQFFMNAIPRILGIELPQPEHNKETA